MPSNAISGVGTRFRRWNGAAWQDIAEINSISGPNMSRDTFDVTSLSSTGGYREKKPGFRNPGQLSLGMNFTRATYHLMKLDYESDVIKRYEIVFQDPENTTLEITGYVIELGFNIPLDDKITSDVTIEISGPVTENSGANVGEFA